MRILFITASFFKQGAVARYAVELAEKFSSEHEVHVLASWVDYEIDGVTVHKYPLVRRPHYMQVGLNAIKNTYFAKKLDKRYDFDIIHSQGAESLYFDVAKAPSCHKAAVEKFKRERGLGYRILKTFEPASNIVLAIERHNYMKRDFKKIIAVSQGTKKEIQHYYGLPDEYLTVIPNGVNVEEFKPGNRRLYRGQVRERYGFSESDIVLLFVGWEFKRKGLKYIIEALPNITEDAKLLVVGGDKKDRYARQAAELSVADRVVFAGHQRNASRYYAASDVFVFPTSYEPFGMVITEAMASGLAVVTTKSAGAAELMTDGVEGLLLDSPYDSAELAEKVQHIIDNDLAKKMGSAGVKTAGRYSYARVAGDTMRVYEEILD
jgi:UDP-glucose:(heptosyl)LPS alpha-1,3-glucosyltransferase